LISRLKTAPTFLVHALYRQPDSGIPADSYQFIEKTERSDTIILGILGNLGIFSPICFLKLKKWRYNECQRILYRKKKA
jgi:hypothetical protein